MRVRLGFATGAVCAVVLLAPAGASAAEQCLFQGMKVNAKNLATVERSVLCLTNLHRFRNGLPPLTGDTRLGTAARNHSADMVARGFFDHTNPEGAGPGDRATAAGYPGGAGENLAANGTGTAAVLFTQWRLSAGHNANMLGDYRAAGMGVAPGFPGGSGGGGPSITGTQMFGLAAANTGDTGLAFYASSDKCAKARTVAIRIKASIKNKKGLAPGPARKLKKARARIKHYCKPLR